MNTGHSVTITVSQMIGILTTAWKWKALIYQRTFQLSLTTAFTGLQILLPLDCIYIWTLKKHSIKFLTDD